MDNETFKSPFTLEYLNGQIRRAGFTPSASGWQDSTGHCYACSIEASYIDGQGTHPDFEASFNPGTRWLEIGKEKWCVASNLTMDILPIQSRL